MYRSRGLGVKLDISVPSLISFFAVLPIVTEYKSFAFMFISASQTAKLQKKKEFWKSTLLV